MPAFLLLDKCRTWHGLDGVLLTGGYLKFYVAGTTTPLAVYGERALTTNNGSTVALGASARLVYECWGNTTAAYFVEVYDSDNVKHGEISHMEVSGGTGQVIPVPNSGEYLTGDGVSFIVEDLTAKLVPDQTGLANKILGTDGTTASWIAKPEDGAAGTSDIATTATTIKVGNKLTQTGTATGTSSGGRTQSVSVTFPTAYDSTPLFVGIEVSNNGLSSFGNMPSWSIITKSTTGFTVKFTMGELDDSRADFNFNAGVNFSWSATGTKA